MRLSHFPALLGVVVLVMACAPVTTAPGEHQWRQDIHEHLSDAIAKEGFSHRIVSDRNPSTHVDSIHLRIPLDGMKRRHEGVERVLVAIAQVCALPDYKEVPIGIVVATVDEEDGRYLRSVLEQQIAGMENITLKVVVGSGEGIVIAVRHPPHAPRSR